MNNEFRVSGILIIENIIMINPLLFSVRLRGVFQRVRLCCLVFLTSLGLLAEKLVR